MYPIEVMLLYQFWLLATSFYTCDTNLNTWLSHAISNKILILITFFFNTEDFNLEAFFKLSSMNILEDIFITLIHLYVF